MRKKCISMVLAVLVTLSFFTIMPIAKADVYSLGSLTFSEAYQNNFDGATDQSVQNEFTVLGGAPKISGGALAANNSAYVHKTSYTNVKYGFTMNLEGEAALLALRGEGDGFNFLKDDGALWRGLGVCFSEDNAALLLAADFTKESSQSAKTFSLPLPEGVDLKGTTTVAAYDLDSKILLFLNDKPFAAIALSGLSGGCYSMGTVYDKNGGEAGSFEKKTARNSYITLGAKGEASFDNLTVESANGSLTASGANAKTGTITATDISAEKSNGVAASDGLMAPWDRGGYAAFENVALPEGVKSVEVVASARGFQGHADGDFLEFRLDSPQGDVLAVCEITITGSHDNFKTFTAPVSLSKQAGVHDIYVVSTLGRYDCLRLKSFAFSAKACQKQAYVPVPKENYIDMGYDTLVAVNDLGQSIPDYEEVGAPREDKTVILYFVPWHDRQDTGIMNVNEFIKKHPEVRYKYEDPLWEPGKVSYFWNEPLWGYYSSLDRWVLRRQIQMICAAGIDVLLVDNTNGNFSWKTGYTPLFEELRLAKENGLNPPKVMFMLPFGPTEGSAELMKNLYLSIYKDGNYQDFWFYLDGKPLILAYDALDTYGGSDAYNRQLASEMRSFFTFRYPTFAHDSSTGYTGNGLYWQWLAVSPLIKYNNEYMAVSIAQNTSAVPGTSYAMNAPYVMGRNYTHAYGFDNSEGAYRYNYNFYEEWQQAIELDPSLVFVVGWNEWTSGPHESWGHTPNGFADQFDNRNSRDIEPTKDPEMLDNSYFHLVENVRRFKGVRKTPVASAAKTISMDASFADWDDVGPAFRNVAGLTEARNAPGRVQGVTYTNNTGRNGIVLSKAARDDENIYFYAETEKELSPMTDPNWMLLFLNTDSNIATGWNGYDYVINYGKAGAVCKNIDGAFQWEEIGTAEIKTSANKLELKIPRACLGLNGEINLEFKWSDNMQEEDVMDFWVNGNCAPLGRFNYKFTEIAQQDVLPAATREALLGTFLLAEGKNFGYANGLKVKMYEADTRVAAKQFDGKLYAPLEFLGKALGAKAEWDELAGSATLKMGENTLRVTASEMRLNGALVQADAYLNLEGGVAYLPVKAIAAALGYEAKETGGVLCVGKTIDSQAASQAVSRLQ